MSRIRDNYFTEVPNFQNRYWYAKFTNSYDIDAESKFGYLDGADICLEGNKSIEELRALLEASTSSDDYERGYRQAIKDYIKQETKGEK